MILFTSDYAEGAHPRILDALVKTNLEQTPGYGTDAYCQKAEECILEKCNAKDAAVHFFVGGTQTNLTVVASMLRPHQCVISAESGHINTHETGAIESVGHAIMGLPTEEGKLTAEQVSTVCAEHFESPTPEHSAQPKMVYLSQSTEFGTIYTRQELSDMADVCKKWGLYLFLDGARLAYALAAEDNDLSLKDVAKFCDVFYIGGTKVGALFGEALVITNPALKTDFRYLMKQHGALLAKGRLLGVQFLELFSDGLYEEIGRHANQMANRLREVILKKGYSIWQDSRTNQVFVLLPNTVLSSLEENFTFTVMEKVDESHTLVRICTSWATKESDVLAFEEAILAI